MKRTRFLLPLMACLFALVACEEKDTSSYPPTWKGLDLSSKTVHPGDSIRATACQDLKGHLINSTNYYWTLTCTVVNEDGTTESFEQKSPKIHTNYDGLDNSDPSYAFKIPEGAVGQGTISFRAEYSYSGSGIQVSDGSTYQGGSSMTGYIRSTSSEGWGGATGSATFRIVN